ncbi:MAG: geranylgeranylglycerol-phosphate geranylgeranyltransferase [Bacteroidota bacterium]
MNIIRLVRFPNLLIVAITQYLIYDLVFFDRYQQFSIHPSLDTWQLCLLVLSTLCIAAGGYIINDVLDYEIDLINKPDRLIIGRIIPIRTAKQLYYWSIALGFAISFYLALVTDNLPLLVLYPIAVALLYFYSRYFKKSFLTGNLIVAFFCAFVAGIVWVAERDGFTELTIASSETAAYLRTILLFYLLFAFISTLFREIIKDIEDIEGDRIGACTTLPIVLGLRRSKIICAAIALVLILLLFSLIRVLWVNTYYLAILFAILFIFSPIIYALFKLYAAENSKDFGHISQIAKLIMLTGLIMLFLIA